MAATPKSAWGWVKAQLHSVYDQPDAEAVHAQFDRILDALVDKLPAVAQHLDAARTDILAFAAFPRSHWPKVWSTNPVRHEAPRHGGEVRVLPCRVVAAA